MQKERGRDRETDDKGKTEREGKSEGREYIAVIRERENQ